MKLIGSKIEDNFREILMKSHNELFNEKSPSVLLKLLKTYFPEMKTAYIIEHIPEQGEDLYSVLINLDSIIKIEIDRFNSNKKPNIEIVNIKDYERSITKTKKIYLAVAIDLLKRDALN